MWGRPAASRALPVAGQADGTLGWEMNSSSACYRSEGGFRRSSSWIRTALHLCHEYRTLRHSPAHALRRARRRLVGSERAHICAEPRRPRSARGARPALCLCCFRHARRTIDCGARRSPTLRAVAAQPVGERLAAALAGHDWTASWRKNVVSDTEWRKLRDELRREADAWAAVLRTPREVSDVEAGWMAGSVAHIAYHMGAIRQIDRTTRGPTAEDEARASRRS